METKFWVRRALLAVVWGLAVSTWASIGHHLMGLPDVGPLLVIGTAVVILVLPLGRARSAGRVGNQAKPGVQASSPTL